VQDVKINFLVVDRKEVMFTYLRRTDYNTEKSRPKNRAPMNTRLTYRTTIRPRVIATNPDIAGRLVPAPARRKASAAPGLMPPSTKVCAMGTEDELLT